ncbi:hypothetical protein EDD17DRAFT_1504859 [Pisolithus thermaeus]|nr:hypothetical protein EDD17DRAFT_1504859 [Pisolithus thermaeus]
MQPVRAAGSEGRWSCGPCCKRKKKYNWAAVEEVETTAGPSRKRAGTGGSWGEGQKKGQPNNEDDDNDEDHKVTEIPALVDPHSQTTYLQLVVELSVMGVSVDGVPQPLYDEHMLIVHGRIAAVMEQLALAMEVQDGAIWAYVRHVMAFPPWPVR